MASCDKISDMPIMPFNGVRISCVMLVRNWVLARLAASAQLRAVSSACSVCLRAVMLCTNSKRVRCRSSIMDPIDTSAGNSCPSARVNTSSITARSVCSACCCSPPLSRYCRNTLRFSAGVLAAIRSMMGTPVSESAARPSASFATGLAKTILPSGPMISMASGAVSHSER